MTKKRAIVIGGGIGGLATAIALRQADLDVEVYERASQLREVGAGISLWGNAVRALEHLGLGKQVYKIGFVDVHGSIRTWQGKPLTHTDMREVQQRVGAPTLIMHRAELLNLLFSAFDNGHIVLGKQCVGFRQNTSTVTAQFADGSEATGDMLIGADGIHSVIRSHIHGAQKPRYSGYTGWRCIIPFPKERMTPGESLGRGARFGQAPMSQGRLYWFATKNATEGSRSVDDEKAELLRTFRGWHSPIEEIIESSDEQAIIRRDIYDRPPLRTWGVGRVTLLGDAAHPMTPNLGQGACLALEDAVVLARHLSKESNIHTALRAYESARKARTSSILQRAWWVGAIGQLQHPVLVQLRDIFIKQVVSHLQTHEIVKMAGYQF